VILPVILFYLAAPLSRILWAGITDGDPALVLVVLALQPMERMDKSCENLAGPWILYNYRLEIDQQMSLRQGFGSGYRSAFDPHFWRPWIRIPIHVL